MSKGKSDYEDWGNEEPDFMKYRRSKQNLLPPPSNDGGQANNKKGVSNSRNPFKGNGNSLRERSQGLNRFPSGIQKRGRPDNNKSNRRPDKPPNGGGHNNNNQNRGNQNNKGNQKQKHNNHHQKQKHNHNNKKDRKDQNESVKRKSFIGDKLPTFSQNPKSSHNDKPAKEFERSHLVYDLHLWNSRQLSSIRHLSNKRLLKIQNESKALIGYKVRIRFRSVLTISSIIDRLAGPIRPISKRVN